MKNRSIALTLVVSLVLVLVLIIGFSIFGGAAALPPISGYGSDPQLPTPDQWLIPVINVANATGWTNGEKPVAAEGMEVTAFASGLDHPRWLYVLPNGDVLAAETNAPPNRPEDSKGIKGWFFVFGYNGWKRFYTAFLLTTDSKETLCNILPSLTDQVGNPTFPGLG